jgi:arginine-tRNA-protein transferase
VKENTEHRQNKQIKNTFAQKTKTNKTATMATTNTASPSPSPSLPVSSTSTTTISSIATSIIRPCGYSDSVCGYCKGGRAPHVLGLPSHKPSSKAYGALADQLAPTTYEKFIGRGWRRSGIHLYKPCNFDSCCPTLSIRLPVSNFQPTKSQRKVRKRMEQLFVQDNNNDNNDGKTKRNAGVPSKGNASKKKQPQPNNNAPQEQAVLDSGILEHLQDFTLQALQQILPPIIAPSLRPMYKIRPGKKSATLAHRVQVATLICAQVAGKYKNDNVVDRNDLCEKLVDVLSKHCLKYKQNGVTIASLERHIPSGQVLVQLQVESNNGMSKSSMSIDKLLEDADADVEDDVTMCDTNNVSMEDSTTTNNTHTSPNRENDKDKLATWYQETMKKPLPPSQRQLIVTTLPAHESMLDPNVHKLYALYQTVVHGDPDPFQPAESQSSPLHEGEEDCLPDLPDLDWGNAPSDWKSRVEDMLPRYFAQYSESLQPSILANYYSFYQFLVESPFPLEQKEREKSNNDATTTPSSPLTSQQQQQQQQQRFGTFHQHYKIGNALIAVGVVDILPTGLSSVYLFYDPSFSHRLVPLGKYAILHEIDYTLNQLKLPYYYLGYYIESCTKMRYKVEYQPSELLCPVHYQWKSAELAVPKLQHTLRHVCALVDVARQGEEEESLEQKRQEQIVKGIVMDIGAGINVTIEMLQENGKSVVKPFLQEFALEAGAAICRECILKLN